MAHFQNILLIGSSGLVGKAIQAELLAKRGNFSKLGALSSSASAPDPKKAAYWESLSAQGVEITTVDFFDSAALVRAFKGWDVVISAVGLPMVKMQLLMIEAAAVAGVKRFLPSEFGFDLTIPSNRGEKVYAMKIAVADKLEEVSDRYPKFTYTLLAIGSFAAFPFMVPAVYDLDMEKCKANIIGDGEAPISFTSFADTAAYVVAVLSHPEETKNATIRAEGAISSWNQIIKLLEKIQGRQYVVTYESTEDARAKEIEFWAGGDPRAARYALRRVMAEGNAKLPVVQNDIFPEVKPTTDLQNIITEVLREKGLL